MSLGSSCADRCMGRTRYSYSSFPLPTPLPGRSIIAEKENDFGRFVWLELETGLQRAAGIEPGADSLGELRGNRQRGWIVKTAVATEKVSAVAGP